MTKRRRRARSVASATPIANGSGETLCLEKDYTTREGDGSRFTLHLTLRGHKSDVSLDLTDLKAARTDMPKRHQIRQKIKAKVDHLDKSRYGDDILGLKSARILRASPKPEPMTQQRGFGRPTRR